MSAFGGMSQLLKGLIIGVVLIMAIIGTMSLLDKDTSSTTTVSNQNDAVVPPQTNKEIVSPSFTLNPDNSNKSERPSNEDQSNKIGDLNAELVDEKEKEKEIVKNVVEKNNDNAPVLENERTPEEAKTSAPVTYGLMELKAINPANNQALKANFTVYDQKNVKVAESKDAKVASYRLPSGQYKVETTLMKIDEVTKQNIPVVTKSRYMIVRENSTSNQSFELEPPANTGVLQVSATINNQAIRSNFVIQKENGEVVASRNNVTNSLFKLKTGSYKVSVTSGSNKDFRSIEIKAGESTQTVFVLKEAATQGKLLVRVFDTRTSNPLRADIKITSANGTVVQDLQASTKSEITLAPGNYKISVIGPNGTSNKNIRVNSGQALNEVFRFVAPIEAASNTPSLENPLVNQSNDSTNSNTTKINDNVSIKPVENQTVAPVEANPVDPNTIDSTPVDNAQVTLNVIAQDESTGRPIKSNVYIQNLSGKHLDKKTYVDNASFNLDPGTYKVTVRAKDRQNNVKTIRITNQNISETFLLTNPNQQAPSKPIPPVANNNQVAAPAIKQAPKPRVQAQTIQTGFLNIAMRAPDNQRVNRADLRSHFIVTTLRGQKIVELTSVDVGNFKLDVGTYEVTAIHNNKRQKRRIDVRPNQNTRLTFNKRDFQDAKGELRSRIVDQTGRPLRGNLIVKDMRGRIIARANNVSDAVFNLRPIKHTINVELQGLTGSEIVNINANETTVQTFTIAPNNNSNRPQRNNSRDIKDILRDKIEKEIRRTF